MSKTTPFDEFLRGYMAALWWSSTDGENGEIELDQYEPSEQAISVCREECRDFYDANEKDIDEAARRYDLSRGDGADTGYDYAGHDFALTRNRHGAGFWDRGFGELGERLTKASHAAGGVNPYLGADELIHIG